MDIYYSSNRLLKNTHLRLSGPLTFSRACQELLLTRRNGTLILALLDEDGWIVGRSATYYWT
jgi:hypothetical protein